MQLESEQARGVGDDDIEGQRHAVSECDLAGDRDRRALERLRESTNLGGVRRPVLH